MKKKILGLGAGLLSFGMAGVASADEVYTVIQGDTVSSISQKFNTTVEKIDEANNLINVDMIYVGQKLTIPTANEITNATTFVTPQKETVETTPVKQIQTDKNQPNNHDMGCNVKPQKTQYPQSSNGESVKQRFLAAGGTEALWNNIVMPESGGDPNAISPNGYRGLGQTKESWANGSVEQQTKGMVDYCNRRYGGISQAITFRQANGWY